MRLAFLNSGRRRTLGAAAVVTAFAVTASGTGDRASESMFGGAHLEARSWRSYDHFVPSTPENVGLGRVPEHQAANRDRPVWRDRRSIPCRMPGRPRARPWARRRATRRIIRLPIWRSSA